MGEQDLEQTERNAEIVQLYESTAHLPWSDPKRWGYGRLAKQYNVSRTRIQQIVRRKRKEAADGI